MTAIDSRSNDENQACGIVKCKYMYLKNFHQQIVSTICTCNYTCTLYMLCLQKLIVWRIIWMKYLHLNISYLYRNPLKFNVKKINFSSVASCTEWPNGECNNHFSKRSVNKHGHVYTWIYYYWSWGQIHVH